MHEHLDSMGFKEIAEGFVVSRVLIIFHFPIRR